MTDRPCGTHDVSYRQDTAIVRTRLQWGLLIVSLMLLSSLPFFSSDRLLHFINLAGITLISIHGLNILTGLCGQLSLGQAAFMAVGAYTSAILTIRLGVPFWVAMPCAGLSAGILGLIFGLPSLRLKGFYLAMATLAAQFIIPALIVNVFPEYTGGTSPLRVPSPKIGDFVFNTESTMAWIIIPMAVLMTVVAKNIARSSTGRAFVAVRDNDLAAGVTGINIFSYKLIAFFICAVFAGIAGSLWAHWVRVIGYEHFGIIDSIWFLAMVIVGGMGSTAGMVFGVVFLRSLDEFATRWLTGFIGGLFPAIRLTIGATIGPIVYGLVIMLFLIFEPRGLAHWWEMFKRSYRLRPFSY